MADITEIDASDCQTLREVDIRIDTTIDTSNVKAVRDWKKLIVNEKVAKLILRQRKSSYPMDRLMYRGVVCGVRNG